MSLLTRQETTFINELYLANSRMLTGYARRFLGDSPDAATMVQDAVQETWLRAVRDVDVLIKHDNPPGWLLVTLRHVLLDGMRTERKRLRYFTAEGVENPADQQERIAQEAMAQYTRVWLAQVTDAAEQMLTPLEKGTFRDYFLNGYSMEETAERQHLPLTTVRGRIRRIRTKLRRHFEMD